LFQPSNGIGPLNPFNVLAHVSRKKSMRKVSFLSKIGFCFNVLFLMKVAEKTAILTVSKSLVDDFEIMDPRIKFIPIMPGNGVDLSRIPKDIGTSDYVFQGVFFARLIADKGIFDLIKIWKEIVAAFPKAKLAVCGIVESVSESNKFFREIEENNLGDNIVYLGQKDKDSLYSIVQRSCLTVYPSYFDAFPLAVLESLACGTPVVAYDTSSVRHNFGACKSVFRCPVGDKHNMAEAITRVLELGGRRSSLSSEAVEFASSYDWSNVVRAEKKAYEQVIRMKRRN
jgi:glycosyltransferase involved in cell wall biosynthesis